MLISLEKDQNKTEDKARLKVRIMTSVSCTKARSGVKHFLPFENSFVSRLMLRESEIERNVAGKETFIYLDRFLTFELGNWSQSFSSTPPVHILWRVTWSRAVCVHERHVMLPVFLSSTVATYSSEGKLRTKPTKMGQIKLSSRSTNKPA